MYANPQYSVMVNGMISLKFTSSFGVKQGCCMSPVLSNIFQNDIHDIFSQDECDPVRLYDIYINSISWADDLLILSHSRKGLQTCLDKLHAYCSKWGLVVNQTKTKTMVFSKNKWQLFICTVNQSSHQSNFQYMYTYWQYMVQSLSTVSEPRPRGIHILYIWSLPRISYW